MKIKPIHVSILTLFFAAILGIAAARVGRADTQAMPTPVCSYPLICED